MPQAYFIDYIPMSLNVIFNWSVLLKKTFFYLFKNIDHIFTLLTYS